LESQDGVDTSGFPEILTLFFASISSLSSWMAVSGMAAQYIVECLIQTPFIGAAKLMGMFCGIKNSIAD
jgi:hypothetical protein